jgi:hypothetical protein
MDLFDRRLIGDLLDSTSSNDMFFSAPFNPTMTFYQQIFWEANDPLVHYTVEDLTDQLYLTNTIIFFQRYPSEFPYDLTNRVSNRYQPWGGNPYFVPSPNRFNLGIKDAQITRSDDWNFPSEQPLDLSNLARIHRGTPWQTVYLKSQSVGLRDWKGWVGARNDSEAALTNPTNDWRLAGLFCLILNTNPPLSLLSLNDPDTNSWMAAFDGITVLTNSDPPQFLSMHSNDPQVAAIVSGIQQQRLAQGDHMFAQVGDVVSTPELSVSSPWLNYSPFSSFGAPEDEAFEIIPTELLPRLRSESVGSLRTENGRWIVEFTGYDHFAYAVEVSSNLTEWVAVTTNYPSLGQLRYSMDVARTGGPLFYRSKLLPSGCVFKAKKHSHTPKPHKKSRAPGRARS